MVYIAFLRGVNVGGHTVKMERLRELFAELGFENVRTYIQSGNVFFETPKADRKALTLRIEKHLSNALGFEAPVFLRSIQEVEEIMAGEHFKGIAAQTDTRLCVVFAEGPIPRNIALPLYSPKKDVMIVGTGRQEAYVVWYIADGRPPAAQPFLDKTLGMTSTTRFYHTLGKILAAARL